MATHLRHAADSSPAAPGLLGNARLGDGRDGQLQSMATRVTYHVTPYVNGWQVKPEGSAEKEVLVDNKDNAVSHAKDLAKAQALGQVIVHKGDGTIETEFTYGDDPRNIPG